MKKFLGCGGALIITILALVTIIAVSEGAKGTGGAKSETTTTTTEAKAPASRVSKATYEQLQPGMTPEQVAEVLGTPGEESSSSSVDMGVAGSATSTVRNYRAEGFMAGNVTVIYSNGVLQSKSQFGLK